MREDMMETVAIDYVETVDAVADATGSVSADLVPGESGFDETGMAMEKPAISELQVAADTFNSAFNMALSELESSRRLIAERSARISELDEAIRATSSRLDDEIQIRCGKEAQYLEETDRLNQRIQEVESERDCLQERIQEQETRLGERAGEINGLSCRIEELNTALEENAATGTRAIEALESEKSGLNGRLNELQQLYDEAGRKLEEKQQEVEKKDRQIAEFGKQTDDLLGEVDALRNSYADLQVHAEKLENLNHALHESAITEKAVHKQQLEEKDRQLESQRSHSGDTEAAGESLPDSAAEMDDLKQSLGDLEARLEAAVTENLELAEKAEKTGRLEDLNGRLRVALRRARDHAAGNNGESPDLIPLQEKVVDLQSALEAAGEREKDLAEKLQSYEAGTAGETGTDGSSRDESGGMVDILRAETDRLGAELSASEEKCRQLEMALAMATNAAGSCAATGAEQGMTMHEEAAVNDRPRFISSLEDILAQQETVGGHHSLMYVLLDNFVRIRDEIGLVGSGSVVREVEEIIEAECKEGDFVARFGDCTFAVLCSGVTAEEAEERACRICTTVEARIFEYNGKSLMTTTSIGVCSVRRNDVNPEDVISRVDVACDAARLSGGNRVIASSAVADALNMAGNTEERENMVRSTISENRVRIYYQPISSLRGQSGSHFEVLVRLVDNNGDMILPGEFFAMAESAGCASEVDRYVIDHVLQEISGSGGQHVKYYIKLTRQSAADNDLPDYIVARIKEYGVEPGQLVFEISENILQSDLKNIVRLSGALSGIGCKIAIEHYKLATSQQHLMHVHVDFLKIDKSLVESIDKRGESLAKVTAIIDLAEKNNYTTIAEGVESPASLAILWEMGVSMAQGYFIQAPAVNREYVEQNVLSDCDDEFGSRATFVIS
ncbi:MAG TPA: EAL domain-containing protein [Gammaproteobacteria bacterium]|nr:EAL domain-containing protein [Gammaproteobacteria bacterium]